MFQIRHVFFSGLTNAEIEIVDLLYKGMSRAEVSAEFRLPRKDLNAMIAKIGEKYLAGSKAE